MLRDLSTLQIVALVIGALVLIGIDVILRKKGLVKDISGGRANSHLRRILLFLVVGAALLFILFVPR